MKLSSELQPLLSSSEINQLIAGAGTTTHSLRLSSNRFTQFGEQASNVIGSGLDFADRRPYMAGDDPRFIDWRASARSTQTLVRRYHTELNSPACIVIDRRASMAFGTHKRLKVTQAVRAGIILGVQMLRGGSQLACLLLDQPDYWQSTQSDLSAFRQTIQLAARACPPSDKTETADDWNRTNSYLINQLAQGSRLILISDFLTLNENTQQSLRQLAYKFDVTALQIFDPAEREIPALDNLALNWGNKTQKIHNSRKIKQQLKQDLAWHFEQQKEWFNKANCKLIQLSNSDEVNNLAGKI